MQKINSGSLQLDTLDKLQTFAEMVSKSDDYLPKQYKNKKPEQRVWDLLVAIQLGAELGLTPMSAINNIAVVNGVPTMFGDMVLGLVRASGLLEEIDEGYTGAASGLDFDEKRDGNRIKDIDLNFRAICSVKRKGANNVVVSEFSIADARKAGLWGKQGPWSTHPKRMLKYKARSFALRDTFPDVLKGLHTVEEMEAEAPINARMQSSSIPVQEINESESEALMKSIISKVDEFTVDQFKTECPSLMEEAKLNLHPNDYTAVRDYATRLYKVVKEDWDRHEPKN